MASQNSLQGVANTIDEVFLHDQFLLKYMRPNGVGLSGDGTEAATSPLVRAHTAQSPMRMPHRQSMLEIIE